MRFPFCCIGMFSDGVTGIWLNRKESTFFSLGGLRFLGRGT